MPHAKAQTETERVNRKCCCAVVECSLVYDMVHDIEPNDSDEIKSDHDVVFVVDDEEDDGVHHNIIELSAIDNGSGSDVIDLVNDNCSVCSVSSSEAGEISSDSESDMEVDEYDEVEYALSVDNPIIIKEGIHREASENIREEKKRSYNTSGDNFGMCKIEAP